MGSAVPPGKRGSHAKVSSRVVDPRERVDQLVNKTIGMKQDRLAIIRFNKMNAGRDPQGPDQMGYYGGP